MPDFRFQPLLLAFMLSLLAGCQQPYDAALVSIEAQMNDQPDSAYARLQTLDTTRYGEADRHYYTYLNTRACDKLHLAVTWPEAMQEAADYLADAPGSDDMLRFYVYYYAGIAQKASLHFGMAVEDFFRSLDYLPADHPYNEAFVYQNLHECYADQNMMEEAIATARRAASLFAMVNRPISEAYSYQALGTYWGMRNNANLDSIRYYLDQSYLAYSHANDFSRMAGVLNIKSQLYSNADNLELGLGLIRRAIQLNPTEDDNYLILGMTFSQLDERDSALYYLNEKRLNAQVPNRRYDYYEQLYLMEQRLGNHDAQIRWADSIISCKRQIEAADENLAIQRTAFNYQEKELREEYEGELSRIRLQMLVFGFLIAASLVLAIWRRRLQRALRKNSAAQNARMLQLLLMADEDEEMEDDDIFEDVEYFEDDSQHTDEMSAPTLHLPEGRKTSPTSYLPAVVEEKPTPQKHNPQVQIDTEMATLRSEQMAQSRKSFAGSRFYKEWQQLLMTQSPRLTEDKRSELQQAILADFSGVMQGLLMQYSPRLKPTDSLLCIAFALGCNIQQCAAFLGTTDNGIRSRKKRVRQVLTQEDFSLFFDDGQ